MVTGNDREGENPERLGKYQADAKSLQAVREAHITRVLKLAQGNLEMAAEMLEISLPELRRWLKRLGIE